MKPRESEKVHLLPVFVKDTGEMGYLFLAPRTAKPLKNIFKRRRSEVSREPRLKSWFIPDTEIDGVVAAIKIDNKSFLLCEECLGNEYCPAWPKDPYQDFGPGDGFAGKARDVYEEGMRLLEEFFGRFNRPKFVPPTASGTMSRTEAAMVLSVSEDCTLDELNKAFKEAAMRSHPDRGGSNEAMAKAVEARSVLRR